jgi:lysophospholipase L1-like esterase
MSGVCSYPEVVNSPSAPHASAGQWRRYLALGDSFSEGLMDVVGSDGRHVGWADRVAGELALLARARGEDGIEYANLAVRGRLVRQVIGEQVPAAVLLRPDLVSLAVGVNDTLRRTFDLNAVATSLENGVRDLRGTGADVLLFSFGDPTRRSRVMRPVRSRIHGYNSAVSAIASRYGCFQASFWDVAAYDDDALWDQDWLHLSPAGHRLVARTALEALGLGDDAWRTPDVSAPPERLYRRLGTNTTWTTQHLVPWLARRARGGSSGDGVVPKYPTWVPVTGPPQEG